jgi:hypothetical protein
MAEPTAGASATPIWRTAIADPPSRKVKNVRRRRNAANDQDGEFSVAVGYGYRIWMEW